jgi:hypothetical protein
MPFACAASRRALGALLVSASLAGLAAPPVSAQGDLLIAPTRLVLDGRRGGEVILSNVGSEEATYRVTLELRRMTPEGELEPVDASGANATEKAALEMIRYAPRRVTLPPDQPQAVRISARPAPELPDGEYRVHLSFAAIPKVQPIVAEQPASPGGLTINLTPIYGITMPIIVRKGELQVTAALANPRLVAGNEGPAFAVDISRSGTASLYGDLLVYRPGNDEPLFVARGLGIYPEIQTRHSVFGISGEQAAALRGPVRVEFRQPLDDGGSLIAAVDAVLD